MSIWAYRYELSEAVDLSGFAVEAVDGEIGEVDEATYHTDASYIVVRTGPWIFGKEVMLPAGVIERIDPENRRLYVDRTKDEIKRGPEFVPERRDDPAHAGEFTDYYGGQGKAPLGPLHWPAP